MKKLSIDCLPTRVFLIALFIGCSAVKALAGPSISSVSGTISQGSTVTITGGGFGQKNPAKPLIWADFESSIQPTSLGRTTAWGGIENFSQVTAGTTSGSGVAQGATNQSVWTLRADNTVWNAYGQQTYVYMLAKKNFQVSCDTSQNWKVIRFWAAGTTLPDFYCGRDAWITESCGTTQWFACRDFVANTWATQEFRIQANSSLGAADGKAYWDINGNARGTANLTTRCSAYNVDMVTGYVVHFVAANIGSWVNPAWSSSNQVWVDDVYVDTTWARVMVCEASTYSSCTRPVVQIPSAWSDASITVTVNVHNLNSSSSKYLYVFDANGNVNTNGYLLPSQTSGPAPKTPTNLRLQ